MTKSKPQIKIVNCATGEEITRDATNEEIAQIEIDTKTIFAEKQQLEEKKSQRQAILDRLGITADEAKLLIG